MKGRVIKELSKQFHLIMREVLVLNKMHAVQIVLKNPWTEVR